MFHKTLARGFFAFSVVAGVFAGHGWVMRDDLWIASTQWMEIAIYLLALAIYIRISEADDVEELVQRNKKTNKKTGKKRKGSVKHKTFRMSEEE